MTGDIVQMGFIKRLNIKETEKCGAFSQQMSTNLLTTLQTVACKDNDEVQKGRGQNYPLNSSTDNRK